MFLKEYGKAKAHTLALFGLEPPRNPNPTTNGEYDFLHFVSALPEIAGHDAVIDVGANHGDWTLEAIQAFDGTDISRFFCVEPVPTFAAHLRGRFALDPAVSVLETALSSLPSSNARIFEIGGGGRLYLNYRGALESPNEHPPQADAKSKKIVSHSVAMSTGDDVFREVAFRPYLLKIDCDGHDGHVLRGFESLINHRRMLVQFEYCDFWIGAQSTLEDACRLLYAAGYHTYKLFPDRLLRFSCGSWFETYSYQNIVAAPAEFPSFARKSIEFTTRR
jgi:FkbM family methyltransferase